MVEGLKEIKETEEPAPNPEPTPVPTPEPEVPTSKGDQEPPVVEILIFCQVELLRQ